MKLPSKELLSEVLGAEVVDVTKDVNPGTIRAYRDSQLFSYENICKLTDSMKKWVINKGISIDITLDANMCVISLFGDVTSTDRIVRKINPTEFEAVTEACEWVFENEKEVQMKLPSKELLSEVLGLEITYLSDRLDGVMLPYQVVRKEGWNTINVYELAHKHCYEWGLKRGYDIAIKEKDDGIYGVLTDNSIIGLVVEGSFVFSHDIPECINREECMIRACEWILKQGEK